MHKRIFTLQAWRAWSIQISTLWVSSDNRTYTHGPHFSLSRPIYKFLYQPLSLVSQDDIFLQHATFTKANPLSLCFLDSWIWQLVPRYEWNCSCVLTSRRRQSTFQNHRGKDIRRHFPLYWGTAPLVCAYSLVHGRVVRNFWSRGHIGKSRGRNRRLFNGSIAQNVLKCEKVGGANDRVGGEIAPRPHLRTTLS